MPKKISVVTPLTIFALAIGLGGCATSPVAAPSVDPSTTHQGTAAPTVGNTDPASTKTTSAANTPAEAGQPSGATSVAKPKAVDVVLPKKAGDWVIDETFTNENTTYYRKTGNAYSLITVSVSTYGVESTKKTLEEAQAQHITDMGDGLFCGVVEDPSTAEAMPGVGFPMCFGPLGDGTISMVGMDLNATADQTDFQGVYDGAAEIYKLI